MLGYQSHCSKSGAKIFCNQTTDNKGTKPFDIPVFHKHKKLTIIAILVSEVSLREIKKIQQQNVTPVSIEPRTSAIWI